MCLCLVPSMCVDSDCCCGEVGNGEVESTLLVLWCTDVFGFRRDRDG